MAGNKSMCSSRSYESGVEGGMVRISEMRAFSNHPYHVEKDAAMLELVESIQTEGILVPLLIRTVKEEGYRFEIISGHRRKMAAEIAGLSEVPAIIREMDDDQAIIAMTDSNLHREYIKPSEKAFAYKMRLEAMKHQGKKNMMTSDQVEPKCNEPQGVKELTPSRSNELLAKMVGENVNQIKRYIRLTYLIPQILLMVDEGKLALTSAVELSFLRENEQYELHAIMDLEQSIPSLSQANRMKRISQQEVQELKKLNQLMAEENNQLRAIGVNVNQLTRFTNRVGIAPQYRELYEILDLLKKDREEREILWQSIRQLLTRQKATPG